MRDQASFAGSQLGKLALRIMSENLSLVNLGFEFGATPDYLAGDADTTVLLVGGRSP